MESLLLLGSCSQFGSTSVTLDYNRPSVTGRWKVSCLSKCLEELLRRYVLLCSSSTEIFFMMLARPVRTNWGEPHNMIFQCAAIFLETVWESSRLVQYGSEPCVLKPGCKFGLEELDRPPQSPDLNQHLIGWSATLKAHRLIMTSPLRLGDLTCVLR